jgi:transcriptional regulator with XRE-family HTH domain
MGPLMKVDTQLDTATQKLIVQIGQNIRAARKHMNMTQEQLAEAADISEKFLSSVENGREKNLSVRYLMSISIALGVPFEEIVSRHG